ncbi:MAG: hypothetical protein GY716_06670 [bacterium]|nr:hypothetical protein [bacterium]
MRYLALLLALSAGVTAQAQTLPPPPQPSENPLTEEKRVLGKILFWDEQLSSDNTISCGTCHLPGSGGGDPRFAVNPGPDNIFGSPDDIIGSPGVARSSAPGQLIEDSVFGFGVQVTARSANSPIGAAYAPELFHDGRASSVFTDPETQTISIAVGGGLESQAIGPILSDVEMASEGREWHEVKTKLSRSLPLGEASALPADVAGALDSDTTYADLFSAAFGDPEITAERIAFAIAGYERTLVADQTPWDDFMNGNPNALSPIEMQGWIQFQATQCNVCHAPPTFTDHSFRNIGIRPPDEDLGRQEVTGLPQDRGRFKVPTLRNTALRSDFMHNGRTPTLRDAVAWYRPGNPLRFPDNLDPLLPLPSNPQSDDAITQFLIGGLTDPRVAAETFPFDRPTLHAGNTLRVTFGIDDQTLSWPALQGAQSYNVYRGNLSGLPFGDYGQCMNDPNSTDTVFTDTDLPLPGNGFFYIRTLVDSTGVERNFGATGDGSARQVASSCP